MVPSACEVRRVRVIKILSLVSLLAGLNFLCSCGKSGSEPPIPAKSATAVGALPVTPFEVVTKSGVEMVYLARRRVRHGNERRQC